MVMNNEISVILPEIIPVLRDKKNQDVALDKEEYSIYFILIGKNMTYRQIVSAAEILAIAGGLISSPMI